MVARVARRNEINKEIRKSKTETKKSRFRLMTKWHLCVAFSKIYKDEVALASLREGGGPPQVVVGAREH